MNLRASTFVLALALAAVPAVSQGQNACEIINGIKLQRIEARYATATVGLSRAQQWFYRTKHTAAKAGGPSLTDCLVRTPKIDELEKTLADMISLPFMSIVSGNGQGVSRINSASGLAKAKFAPLQVVVKNGGGQPIANAPVVFSCATPYAMKCQMEPMGSTRVTSSTDGSGIATANRMEGNSVVTYYGDGPFTITATSGASSATFQLASVASDLSNGGANVISIIAGDKQSVQRTGERVGGGSATFGPLSVVLKDRSGTPLPGVRLSFRCGKTPPSMTCDVHSGGGTTDANGVLTLSGARGDYQSGKMPVTVSGDNTNEAVFDLTVLDALPPPAAVAGATMTIVSGDGQKVARTATSSGIAMASFAPLQVVLKDRAGKPIANARVVFACPVTRGMVCQFDPLGGSKAGEIFYTDANGVATAHKMSGNSVAVYYGDGPFTVVATYGTVTATFRLTVGQ